MIDAPLGSRDAEGDCMLTLITMHEDGGDDTLTHANLIFDAAAHSQQVIETISSLDIFLTDNAVAQSAGAGLETPMHPAPRMERLTGLHFRPVEDFHRRPVRVGQLEHCEHVPFRGLVCGAYAILDSCFRQFLLQLSNV